jgi:hypothetical protein
MNNDELISDIKSLGYWRIEFRSTEYKARRITTRASMEALVSKASVSLRGWPYPYYETGKTAFPGGQWLEGRIMWGNYREYWRLYESGQWIHYARVYGAGEKREEVFKGRSPLPPVHEGYIHVRGLLFTLTEMFQFAVGISQSGILDPTAYLSVQLHNTKDYMLYESFDRFFTDRYVNPTDVPIMFEQTLPVNELLASANQMALDMAIKVYSVFNWTPADAAIRTLGEDQKKLIERRL